MLEDSAEDYGNEAVRYANSGVSGVILKSDGPHATSELRTLSAKQDVPQRLVYHGPTERQ